MNTTESFESTPDLDVRGRRDSIPDPQSDEVQHQAEELSWNMRAELWKQRLAEIPTPCDLQSCILSHGMKQLQHSSLTHYGKGPSSEYFMDDFMILKITEHDGHFHDPVDSFGSELGEAPPMTARMQGLMRCGFQIRIKMRDANDYVDYGTVHWHEIAATAGEAITTMRTACAELPKPDTTIL